MKPGPRKLFLAEMILSLWSSEGTQWMPIFPSSEHWRSNWRKDGSSIRAIQQHRDGKARRLIFTVPPIHHIKSVYPIIKQKPKENLEFWNTFTLPNPAKNSVRRKILERKAIEPLGWKRILIITAGQRIALWVKPNLKSRYYHIFLETHEKLQPREGDWKEPTGSPNPSHLWQRASPTWQKSNI